MTGNTSCIYKIIVSFCAKPKPLLTKTPSSSVWFVRWQGHSRRETESCPWEYFSPHLSLFWSQDQRLVLVSLWSLALYSSRIILHVFLSSHRLKYGVAKLSTLPHTPCILEHNSHHTTCELRCFTQYLNQFTLVFLFPFQLCESISKAYLYNWKTQ